jgi:hypothetical protein
MDNYSYSSYILLLIFSILTLCYCQTYQPYITQPTLVSVIPINSTALNVTWQFANSSIDQSDLIRIYIVFYEFYYNYSAVYASTNYTFISTNNTFTSTNKTITNLTINFDLVNAYYYVCFSSNSTITNVTQYLAILNTCVLTRTCLRSNTTCPGPSSVNISATSITINSFIISFLWPNDLPYSPISFSAQLINNNQIGTALSVTRNFSYTNRPYQFTGLQSATTYTVNTSFTYTILGNIITNTTTLTVTTSCSWKLVYSSNLSFIFFSFLVIFFFK